MISWFAKRGWGFESGADSHPFIAKGVEQRDPQLTSLNCGLREACTLERPIQYRLLKEYILNPSRGPHIISGISLDLTVPGS